MGPGARPLHLCRRVRVRMFGLQVNGVGRDQNTIAKEMTRV